MNNQFFIIYYQIINKNNNSIIIDQSISKYRLADFPEYVHVSFNKIETFYDTEQEDGNYFKPIGLYYAKGTEWLKFIQHDFDNEYLYIKSDDIYIYEVVIPSDMKISLTDEPTKKKILSLNTNKQLSDFCNKYEHLLNGRKTSRFGSFMSYIDWDSVSNVYSGINFDNYRKIEMDLFKGRLLKHTWFMAWDVNGGCIWNVNDIRIKEI